MTGTTGISASWFRSVVKGAVGSDPGELSSADRLEDVGVHGFDRLLVLASLESLVGNVFPHELEPAQETVEDFLYYVQVKMDQAGSGPF